jgi:peptidoglycan hydrolase-like protein with peptidoglycan-binding domain
MAWRLAKSLSVLRTEIVARYPGTTVWTIGDQAHASGYSDHNPNSTGVVCAIDVKADGGMSLQQFVMHLITNPHPNLRYVIYNRRIYQRKNGWKAEIYYGSNSHEEHAHASVGNGPDGRSTSSYDNTSTWRIANLGAAPTGIPTPTLREGAEGSAVLALQVYLNDVLDTGLVEDGDFGPATTAAVRELQRRAGITTNGIYDRDTAAALRNLLEDNDMSWDEKIPLITGQGVSYSGTEWPAKFLAASNHYYTLKYGQSLAAEQAKQTALLQQLAAGQSGLTEAKIAAAVAEGVRQAVPTAEELAAAVAAAVDHDLDTAAVVAALREVLGGLDRADE